MSNLLTRAITGLVFVAVIVGAIVGHPFASAGLFLLVTALGLAEFYRLLESAGHAPQKWLGVMAGSGIYALLTSIHLSWVPSITLLAIVPLLVLMFVIELFRNKTAPMLNIGYTVLGILYIAVPFSMLNSLIIEPYATPHTYQLLLGYFILLWTSDTGAYLAGSSFGKHKLFERISPKKTWEGWAGGAVLSVGVAYVLSIYFTTLPVMHWMVIALIVVVFGTLGDLVESMFKRSINVKDSGTILPGHGGILDRFDGVFLSVPLVLAYILFIQYLS